HLVEDLPGLLRGRDVRAGALLSGEGAQRRGRERAVHGQGERGRDQGVPAEQGEEPRRTGREELLVRRARDLQAQRVEVREGALEQVRGGPDLGGGDGRSSRRANAVGARRARGPYRLRRDEGDRRVGERQLPAALLGAARGDLEVDPPGQDRKSVG